jgi:molybdopterin-containing oxidoreductase family iron-sulfur binding subunit
LKDGDVKVACESVCPTGAIVFGDLNDENSRVAQSFKNDPRAYALLEEWYAKPSVRYMSKIRNNDKITDKKDHGSHAQNSELNTQKGANSHA